MAGPAAALPTGLAGDERYRIPLDRDAKRLARKLGRNGEAVLLGSVASGPPQHRLSKIQVVFSRTAGAYLLLEDGLHLHHLGIVKSASHTHRAGLRATRIFLRRWIVFLERDAIGHQNGRNNDAAQE